MASVSTGPAAAPTPRWRRELRILRRDGLWRYLHGAWRLHRFHRACRGL